MAGAWVELSPLPEGGEAGEAKGAHSWRQSTGCEIGSPMSWSWSQLCHKLTGVLRRLPAPLCFVHRKRGPADLRGMLLSKTQASHNRPEKAEGGPGERQHTV